MKYKSFKLDDDEAINKFLAEFKDQIIVEGSRFADGYVCYMYSDKKDEDALSALKEEVTNQVRAQLVNQIRLVIEADGEVRYWTGQVLRQTPGADNQMTVATNVKETAQRKAGYLEDILKEMVAGTWWEANIKNAGNRKLEVGQG